MAQALCVRSTQRSTEQLFHTLSGRSDALAGLCNELKMPSFYPPCLDILFLLDSVQSGEGGRMMTIPVSLRPYVLLFVFNALVNGSLVCNGGESSLPAGHTC